MFLQVPQANELLYRRSLYLRGFARRPVGVLVVVFNQEGQVSIPLV